MGKPKVTECLIRAMQLIHEQHSQWSSPCMCWFQRQCFLKDGTYCRVFVSHIWLSCLFTHCLQKLVLQLQFWPPLSVREHGGSWGGPGSVEGLPPIQQAHNHQALGPSLAALTFLLTATKQDTFLTGWREEFLAFIDIYPPWSSYSPVGWRGKKTPSFLMFGITLN